jgi:hypothetical protein
MIRTCYSALINADILPMEEAISLNAWLDDIAKIIR